MILKSENIYNTREMKIQACLYFKAKKIFGWLGLSEADQARWHIFSFEEPSIKRQAIF